MAEYLINASHNSYRKKHPLTMNPKNLPPKLKYWYI